MDAESTDATIIDHSLRFTILVSVTSSPRSTAPTVGRISQGKELCQAKGPRPQGPPRTGRPLKGEGVAQRSLGVLNEGNI